MRTALICCWSFVYLQCLLVGSLVDSSSLSSAAHSLSVASMVGNKVVLPCSWKLRLGEMVSSAGHVQWTTVADIVFEQWGSQKWQAEGFEGRTEVPEEKLGSGDCSLIIRDVQIRDAGRYESFIVVDSVRSKKTKVFIQGVKLSVFDHKSRQTLAPGEDLVLDLHTRHSARVIFQSRNSSESRDLWVREGENSPRLVKDALKEQLTIKNLSHSDEGTYKVLDEWGLAISTTQLSVEDGATALKFHQMRGKEMIADVATKSSCSALLILSVLVTGFKI